MAEMLEAAREAIWESHTQRQGTKPNDNFDECESRSHRDAEDDLRLWQGAIPAISIIKIETDRHVSDKKTKEISVFVDESGSFEPDENSSRFYLIGFVLHNQDADIVPWIDNLEGWLAENGFGRSHCIHVGPLIRREQDYADQSREIRQAIFRKMMAFIRKADIAYRCFMVDKHFNDGDTAVHDTLLQHITRFLVDRADFFNDSDCLKIYYDNGQPQVKHLLQEAFAMFSAKVEFVPDVKPENYRLFQAADLFCSVELVAAKLNAGCASTSERKFFGSPRDFKRNILRKLKAKEL